MIEKLNTAVIALCLSAVSVGFSAYTWWNSQREVRVATAVEFSKNFIREVDGDTARAFVKAYSNPAIKLPDAERSKVNQITELLEYVAFLGNKEKIDKSYISPSITCFIVLIQKAVDSSRKEKRDFPDVPEIAKYSQNSACERKSFDAVLLQRPQQTN
jgi:hypothetical protein